jgi:hypothetical protein
MSKVKFGLKLTLVYILVPLLIFLLFEGIASTILFVEQLANTKPVAERLHTAYDPELGWVNIPNTHIDDIYGPGRYVHINAQGFRNDEDLDFEVPPGQVWAICSGDSFTFGFGVSNQETWCHLLSELEPRLQTVNMAQGGYGVDQAYLWYERDGDQIAHQLNLFAFITADFDRMQRPLFLGYGKPVLEVENGELVLTNVPVSRQAFVLPWTTTPYQGAFDELKSVQLLNQTFFKNRTDTSRPPIDEPAIQEVAGKILEEMYRLNQERGSELVLVYLPVYADHKPNLKTDTRRRYAEQGAAKLGLIYIDLVDDFRQLPEDELESLFIPNGAIDFPGAAGHYSVKGHEYIANRLYQELMTHPKIVEILDSVEQ